MRYLVDSHYVADFLKGRPEAMALFRQLVPSGISISIITYAEVKGSTMGNTEPSMSEAGDCFCELRPS